MEKIKAASSRMQLTVLTAIMVACLHGLVGNKLTLYQKWYDYCDNSDGGYCLQSTVLSQYIIGGPV